MGEASRLGLTWISGVRRVYEPASDEDGCWALVDRVWPCGLSKESARIDEWCKQVAPSTELRKWYGHDPTRFEEFERRYREELRDPERASGLEHLRELVGNADAADGHQGPEDQRSRGPLPR